MDSRLRLRTPDGFAFIMRVAGSNFRGLEFQTSFAIAIGGVRAIALIGHDQCAMTSLRSRRSEFIDGLIEGADWSREEAESHFDALSPGFEISDPAEFVRSQAQCLRQLYSGVVVAPLMYDVGDGLLYQLDENEKTDQ
jgi:carbonic anhydrase